MFPNILFLYLMVILPALAYGDNIPFINDTPIHEAYATHYQIATPPLIAPKKPPAEKIQNIPQKPAEDSVWIGGYWAWVPEGNEFKWICGVWRRPPPNHEWVSGSWIKNDEGWSWLEGFWNLVPEEKLSFIREQPPIKINENPPPAPDENHFWAFGYWKYDNEKKSYGWTEGSWQKFDRNWVLAPANYIWRPNGYIFVPPYWDYPIDQRGALYSCTYPMNKITVDTVIQSSFARYPDHLSWFQHWHFNKSWWQNCSCIPPWWNWDSWWTFALQDQWTLWWWYTHPGFPQPEWLSSEISKQIPPAPENILDLMNQVIIPEYLSKIPVNANALKATGEILPKEDLPRPTIAIDIKPVGRAEIPKPLPPPSPPPLKPIEKPLPIELPGKKASEENPMNDPSLTPLLDSERPNYSQYEPMYEYKYQPEFKYQPEYYYKPYKEDTFEQK
jgi:hypothetical protein